MTRTKAASALLADAPLVLGDLVAAPELATLAIVEQALQATTLALLAVHPTLQDFAHPREPPSVALARHVLVATAALRLHLRRYRTAVLDALRPCPPQPDISLF